MEDKVECEDCGESLRVGYDAIYFGPYGVQCTDCYFYDSCESDLDD